MENDTIYVTEDGKRYKYIPKGYHLVGEIPKVKQTTKQTKSNIPSKSNYDIQGEMQSQAFLNKEHRKQQDRFIQYEYSPENIVNGLTLGLMNGTMPNVSGTIGNIRNAAMASTGNMSKEDAINGFNHNDNGGIFTREYSHEHPYITGVGNGVVDVLALGASPESITNGVEGITKGVRGLAKTSAKVTTKAIAKPITKVAGTTGAVSLSYVPAYANTLSEAAEGQDPAILKWIKEYPRLSTGIALGLGTLAARGIYRRNYNNSLNNYTDLGNAYEELKNHSWGITRNNIQREIREFNKRPNLERKLYNNLGDLITPPEGQKGFTRADYFDYMNDNHPGIVKYVKNRRFNVGNLKVDTPIARKSQLTYNWLKGLTGAYAGGTLLYDLFDTGGTNNGYTYTPENQSSNDSINNDIQVMRP